MNIETEITLAFNIGFKISHFEMVVNPIHYKVWEPRIFSAGLEKFIE